MRKSIIAALFVGASLAHAHAQGTGSEGYFELHNDTAGNILVSFYTNDGSGWSANWLDEFVDPETSVVVEFIADTGSCDQAFRAGWLGADGSSEVLDDPFTIDICDASNVYLGDNDISYD